jgi:hypothetical protein
MAFAKRRYLMKKKNPHYSLIEKFYSFSLIFLKEKFTREINRIFSAFISNLSLSHLLQKTR